MEIGLYGLGRMGGNMARRLARGGARVLACNRSFEVTEQIAAEEVNVVACRSLDDMIAALKPPRVVWLMLPAGAATEAALAELAGKLAPGDMVVDGANGYYKEAQRRAADLAGKQLAFADVGVSGGIWGLANGYCLMAGGEAEAVARIEPFLKLLAPAPERGWLHAGPAGSGHFVKMIHNGIEYGMMQAFAEGFALMQAKGEFDLDLAAIAELWRHSSVVRSWLLDLTADFLKEDQGLDAILPFVADSGEGRWTALESIEQGVPTPVMTLALMNRFDSQGKADFGNKLLAMMRKGFGGHALKG
ncbi:decarboxylating 6-phosphogluconate dehydrogenase [Parasulfuritortus cantonensis]|uniref:Decarboxylating 6-phosphogluconate dehydrogenase n=1 Tax=Parasulfuritortus cantonensis TaxID=2528202 RepID=A0A4R1BAB9_9PROT|nr:decarboxylating 6-phosphogluconate dehydrogenase [Parasulfuritortus cantonensis]TCJ13867.1 decarboxylating 6-phosphogluconate dehydrogenase [Parasulfuritortus cantonensis]